jgi:Fuc2NAc and GlcNAc transferase
MNLWQILLACAAVCGASTLFTFLVRQRALRQGLLDRPNERSSHTIPTPRGGGLAIVIATSLGCLLLWALGALTFRLLLVMLVGGGAVALAGYLDDRGLIGIRTRISVHFAAAIWAVIWLGGLSQLHWGGGVVELGWASTVLSVIGIVWALNLFNFMDGIDGIAGSQAVFMGIAGAALGLANGVPASVAVAGYVVGAASLGFLFSNWPPARIFMGDVGSGYLGYVIAILALAAAREQPAVFGGWLVLSGVFLIDATVTLLRRLSRREPVYEAHRSHAYQWQARRWGHARVTVAVIVLNLLWLAPIAWLAVVRPELGSWAVVGALLPVALLAWACGAGRHEA